ncbi:MAG: DUF2905 domain-containing protein [Syntrophaceae bacterium]|nr:DUF2905 domain-containing protein [Syntrophaceae bacterium]
MIQFPHIGKILVIVGLVIAGVGFLLLVMGGKIPWIGHLPGDISIRGKNVTFYFPVVTCLIFSVILSLIFFLFRGR